MLGRTPQKMGKSVGLHELFWGYNITTKDFDYGSLANPEEEGAQLSGPVDWPIWVFFSVGICFSARCFFVVTIFSMGVLLNVRSCRITFYVVLTFLIRFDKKTSRNKPPRFFLVVRPARNNCRHFNRLQAAGVKADPFFMDAKFNDPNPNNRRRRRLFP